MQIIEFWYSSCVICIENFGEFEKFYLKNKDNYDITSVNVEIPADKLNNFIPKKYVQQKGYSFPVLELTQEYVEKNYQIFSTPKTVIILNDTIIFKENIIVSDLLISKILKDIDK